MGGSYKVAAGAVVVKLAEGGEQMLLRGAHVSGSKFKAEDVKRLHDIGLIEAIDEVPAEGEGPKSVDDMKLDELKAHAKEHGIELSGATKKDDVLAAIKSAEAKPAEGDGEGGPAQGSEPEQSGSADNE